MRHAATVDVRGPETIPGHRDIRAGVASSAPPLVIDLDGTLTYGDTLVESIVQLLKRQPLLLFSMLGWLFGGRAYFKRRIAGVLVLDVASLPWRRDLLAYIREQHSLGRTIVLATAADRAIATAVAAHCGCFDLVLASEEDLNLKGMRKLDAIRAAVGDRFVYAGDCRADLPIWRAAAGAIVTGRMAGKCDQLGVPIEVEFPRPATGLRTWRRALRLHQSVKNLLVFVPLLTSFSFFDLRAVGHSLVAFVAFSLAASATYIANDIWDLTNDRSHPRKRDRPFASGQLAIVDGAKIGAALLLTGFLLAATVTPAFTVLLAGYVVVTTTYSWAIKRYVLLDAICLAVLYMWRVVAGAAAIGVAVSPWLLAFSLFIFGSLALVKRCAELVSLKSDGGTASTGRDYRVSDLIVLWPMGIGLGLCSVVVFGLYVGSTGANVVYGNTQILWLVGICLLYWIGRLWIKTARGEMHDDPIVFAIRDPGSRMTLGAMVVLTLAAYLVH